MPATGASPPPWQITIRKAQGLSVADYGTELWENEGID